MSDTFKDLYDSAEEAVVVRDSGPSKEGPGLDGGNPFEACFDEALWDSVPESVRAVPPREHRHSRPPVVERTREPLRDNPFAQNDPLLVAWLRTQSWSDLARRVLGMHDGGEVWSQRDLESIQKFKATMDRKEAVQNTTVPDPVEGVVYRTTTGHEMVRRTRSTGKVWLYTLRNGRWEYKGPTRILGEAISRGQAVPLSPEEVGALGITVGRCVFCERDLTDARSKEVGYGETCARRWNLPWGR